MQPPITPAAPMLGADEEMAADPAAETQAPTLSVTGEMAAALTDGKQAGDEFSATVQFRVASAGDGTAELEVIDAVPQETAPATETGGDALDGYLAAQAPPKI